MPVALQVRWAVQAVSRLSFTVGPLYTGLFSSCCLMNKDYVLFHLREAKEELDRTIGDVANDPEYTEADFGIAIAHLYNHVNTAWNARNAKDSETDPLTDERFFQWRAFPEDIDMA